MQSGDIKNYAETAVIIGAVCALIYWWVLGSVYPSLKLALDVERESSGSAQDTLTASLSLENPGRASLSLEHIRIYCVEVAREVSEKKDHEITLTRDRVSGDIITYPNNLAPSDSTHVGTIFSVSSNDAFVVHALVVARIPFLRMLDYRRGMQWRASRAIPRIANTQEG